MTNREKIAKGYKEKLKAPLFFFNTQMKNPHPDSKILIKKTYTFVPKTWKTYD